MTPAAPLAYRRATFEDCPLLAGWNHQLIQDEGHRNTMNVPQLEARLRGWLAGEYQAVVFSHQSEPVAHALYREDADLVYLRQFFVRRDRRRHGFGRAALRLLHSQIWPRQKRFTVEVLSENQAGAAFWRSVGYRDYSLTLEVMPAGSGTSGSVKDSGQQTHGGEMKAESQRLKPA